MTVAKSAYRIVTDLVGLDDVARVYPVYCLGDSLTAAATYPNKLATLLGGSWVTRNAGIAGYETAQMLTRVTEVVIDPGDAEYVVVFGGINDICHDIAEATIKSNLQAIYTAAHNAGIKVVAVKITPFKNFAVYYSAPRQTVLDNVNTWISATAINVDYVVDAYTALEDPAAADTLLAAYDSGDHLHLSTAGYELLATTIHAAVTWTAARAAPALQVAGAFSLNQNLLTTSDVAFRNLYADTLTAEASISTYRATTRYIQPPSDSTTALRIVKADGLTDFVVFDSTNLRVKIGPGTGAVPAYTLEVNGSFQAGSNVRFVRTDGAPDVRIINIVGNNAYLVFTDNATDRWAVGNGVTAVANQFVIYSHTLARSVFTYKSTGEMSFHGATPVARAAHIADPSGGATVDAEARTAINAVLVLLENVGLALTS